MIEKEIKPKVEALVPIDRNNQAIWGWSLGGLAVVRAFIAPDDGGKDVFVHASALEAAGIRTLGEGQKVSFDIQPDKRGSRAANIQPV